MAEKGTLILDQAGGISIATRDAIDPDNLANARVIQQFDRACGQIPSPLGTPTRADVTIPDPDLIASFPAELEANLIDCGDKSTLVLFGRFTGVTVDEEEIVIVPLWYDDEVTPGYIGFSEYVEIKTQAYYQSSVNDGTYIFSTTHEIPLIGAPRVGLFVANVDITNCTAVSVWGFVI